MNNSHKTPGELVEYVIKVGIEKSNKSIYKLAILATLAGALIALGGVANIVVGGTLIKSDTGLAKFIGASVFPVGLILVVTLGGELFTSNCLLTVGLVDKKISIKGLLKNWIIVYLFNYLGSIIIAYITVKTSTFNLDGQAYVESIAVHKVDVSAYSLFLKGILCNILVCGAVALGYMSRDTIGKLVGIWLPVMLFVLIGYDHSIANMFYLNVAKMLSQSLTYPQITYNLFYVTLGNIVGGTILGMILYFCYHKKENKD